MMKHSHPSNSCAGGYGKCLDVKITNQCNARCAFCIERDGYCPTAGDVSELIHATMDADADNILILGGEPLLYPDLERYLQAIRPHKKKIYLTTNGSRLTPEIAGMLAGYLDGINISVHHFSEFLNDQVYQTAHVSFQTLKESIAVFAANQISVRFNTNLVKGCLDRRQDVETMIQFAADMGADEIRFSELQDAEEEYVDARDIFSGLTDDPYTDGCEKVVATSPLLVRVKMTCGCVNRRKASIIREPGLSGSCQVLYPNGMLTNGWLTRDATRTDGCHLRYADGCHLWRQYGSQGCH